VPGPPTQPADTPLTEPGAHCDRCFQTQKLSFKAHAVTYACLCSRAEVKSALMPALLEKDHV
jgi:hypothetical protein